MSYIIHEPCECIFIPIIYNQNDVAVGHTITRCVPCKVQHEQELVA
jgi:hypothetical protein